MKRYLPLLLLIGFTVPAMAHPSVFHGQGGMDTALAGFFHPLTGLDHLVVMIAVGLWAVQLGGRALWILPSSFVGSMILGGLIGLSGLHAPIVESGILASIILLGAALAMAWQPPLWIAALFIGAGGICHGYAHGEAMTVGLVPAIYLTGMIVATSLLHAAGVGTGLLLSKSRFMRAIRVAGLVILVFSAYDFIWPVP